MHITRPFYWEFSLLGVFFSTRPYYEPLLF